MSITVKLFASLQKGKSPEVSLEYSQGITVRQVIESIGIPEDEAAIILVNSRHVCEDKELNDGDVLSLFPLVGGG